MAHTAGELTWHIRVRSRERTNERRRRRRRGTVTAGVTARRCRLLLLLAAARGAIDRSIDRWFVEARVTRGAAGGVYDVRYADGSYDKVVGVVVVLRKHDDDDDGGVTQIRIRIDRPPRPPRRHAPSSATVRHGPSRSVPVHARTMALSSTNGDDDCDTARGCRERSFARSPTSPTSAAMAAMAAVGAMAAMGMTSSASSRRSGSGRRRRRRAASAASARIARGGRAARRLSSLQGVRPFPSGTTCQRRIDRSIDRASSPQQRESRSRRG